MPLSDEYGDAEGEKAKAPAVPVPETANNDGPKGYIPDGDLVYLPCYLLANDSGNDPSIFDATSAPISVRERLTDQILKIASTWQNEDRSEPGPLIFQVNGSWNVSMQPAEQFHATSEVVWKYESNFWIPDSCLHGISVEEKVLRRELFAVGSLVYQLLACERPWESYSDIPGDPEAVKSAIERGNYPHKVLKFSQWHRILACWSPEFAGELKKRTVAKPAGRTTAKRVANGVAVAGGTIVAAAVLSPILLPIIGFGSIGVVGGSIAAGAQSMLGIVEAGSVFALLQSAGMGGAAGIAAIAGIGAAAAATTALATVASVLAGEIESEALDKEELFSKFKEMVKNG